jgi:hypothetical protein
VPIARRAEKLGPPRFRRLGARRATRRLGIVATHLVEHQPLAHVQHVEHVARIVDPPVLLRRRRTSRQNRPEERICGLTGRPEVRGDPAVPHHEAQVELFELVLRRLVDRHDDCLAGLLRELGKQVHERGRVVCGKTARGLVQKEDHRVGHELERDVHALSLASGENLLLGFANLQIPESLEPEIAKRLVDASIDLFLAVVGR